MTKAQAFEVLELFKTKANESSHLHDAYHGDTTGMILWFIFNGKGENSKRVASIGFEDMFPDEEYVIDIIINKKLYQLLDFQTCSELVDSIKYKTTEE